MHPDSLTDSIMVYMRPFIIDNSTMRLYLRDKELLASVRLEVILVLVGLLHEGPTMVVLWVHLDILGKDLAGRVHLEIEAVSVDTLRSCYLSLWVCFIIIVF